MMLPHLRTPSHWHLPSPTLPPEPRPASTSSGNSRSRRKDQYPGKCCDKLCQLFRRNRQRRIGLRNAVYSDHCLRTDPPTNIITALNVASNPALNTAALFNLAPSAAPYQPTLTAAPTDFSIRLTSAGSTGPSGPATLSPTTLTFYQTNVPQTVTMTNSGLTPVVIQSINISPSNWSQTNDCGAVLQAQSICTITVQSTNSALGAFSGTFMVVDDDTNDAQVVQLNTDNETLAGTVDFGERPIGMADFVNGHAGGASDGTGNYLLTGNATGGPNPGDFSFASDAQGPLSLPFSCYGYGGRFDNSCQLIISFTPAAVGTRSSLLVTNTGTYLFTGIGLPHGPYFSFSAASYDLGSTLPDSQVPQAITITSKGDAPVTLLPAVVTGANASDFTITSSCSRISAATPGSLKPGYYIWRGLWCF